MSQGRADRNHQTNFRPASFRPHPDGFTGITCFGASGWECPPRILRCGGGRRRRSPSCKRVLFIPWVTRLVEDVSLLARIREIQSSPGGERLSPQALLMLAFLCESSHIESRAPSPES